MMDFSVRVDNGVCVFEPVIRGDVVYESFHRGRCSVVSFDAVDDGRYAIMEGDTVSVGGFFGVVFGRRKSGEESQGVVLYRTV